MSRLSSHETPYSVVERETPDVLGANLRVGAHLWSSATVFFFIPFFFAYFYLRALDSHTVFQHKGVAPSTTLGTLADAAVVGGAVLVWLGLRDHRADRRPAWRRKGAVALGLLVVSVVLQVVAWSTQGFGPADGAYASIYLGWTGMQVLFVLGLAFWLETTLAVSIRYRGPHRWPAEGEATGDADRTAPDIDDPVSLVRPQLQAVAFYAAAIAAIVAVTWVVLYLL